MEELFPNGMTNYLVGGTLIGIGVSLVFLTTGTRAGASGILTAVFSWGSRRSTFEEFAPERRWRTLFSFGLITGALLITVTTSLEQAPTEVALWRLALGGVLVGFGTRTARGCTSGHGVCGLSSLNSASLLHVLTFMGVAMITARAIRSFS